MKCPICGAKVTPAARRSKNAYLAVDIALNQTKRGRVCENGHSFNTLEIWEGEVQRLRGLAYLGLNKEVGNV
jgi:hypothetical protein